MVISQVLFSVVFYSLEIKKKTHQINQESGNEDGSFSQVLLFSSCGLFYTIEKSCSYSPKTLKLEIKIESKSDSMTHHCMNRSRIS